MWMADQPGVQGHQHASDKYNCMPVVASAIALMWLTPMAESHLLSAARNKVHRFKLPTFSFKLLVQCCVHDALGYATIVAL